MDLKQTAIFSSHRLSYIRSISVPFARNLFIISCSLSWRLLHYFSSSSNRSQLYSSSKYRHRQPSVTALSTDPRAVERRTAPLHYHYHTHYSANPSYQATFSTQSEKQRRRLLYRTLVQRPPDSVKRRFFLLPLKGASKVVWSIWDGGQDRVKNRVFSSFLQLERGRGPIYLPTTTSSSNNRYSLLPGAMCAGYTNDNGRCVRNKKKRMNGWMVGDGNWYCWQHK